MAKQASFTPMGFRYLDQIATQEPIQEWPWSWYSHPAIAAALNA
ncbi:MAG: hypothetical protein ACKOYK_10580 [Cyanobium sp.]